MAKKPLALSSNFVAAADKALEAARKELLSAASAHGIKIKAERIVYASHQNAVLVHAAVAGSEKYKDTDFIGWRAHADGDCQIQEERRSPERIVPR